MDMDKLSASTARAEPVAGRPKKTPGERNEDGYGQFEDMVARKIAAVKGPVFTTNADWLWGTYLAGIPAPRRQHYNCRACETFIKTYGNLVTIGDSGQTLPVLWYPEKDEPNLSFFRESIEDMLEHVRRASVTEVFLWGPGTWGTPEKGGWSHLAGVPGTFYHDPLKTPEQAMAEKKEEHRMLYRGLAEYKRPVVAEALRILRSEALHRSEKSVQQAEWLDTLHAKLESTQDLRRRANLTWLAVAEAPPGWCHIKTLVISTLLDDILAGLPFATIASRWAQKLHPLQYQRPTAAPSQGAIDQAEKLVKTLGIERSLERRYATLADVLSFYWVPPAAETEKKTEHAGVFDHLRRDTSVKIGQVELPPQVMTWEKFRKEVLPEARKIEILVPSSGPFYGLVTAVHPDAPPILQWDGLQDRHEWDELHTDLPRNPVSWYFHNNGSMASYWGLTAQSWTEVTRVFPSPSEWQRPELFEQQGKKVFFAIAGAKNNRSKNAGLALFPEFLKNALHAVRSVIEAHSQKGNIQPADEELVKIFGHANGISFHKDSLYKITLRVYEKLGARMYTLDRWD